MSAHTCWYEQGKRKLVGMCFAISEFCIYILLAREEGRRLKRHRALSQNVISNKITCRCIVTGTSISFTEGTGFLITYLLSNRFFFDIVRLFS